MTQRTLAADDFDTIRERMQEISRESAVASMPCIHTWDHNRVCTKCKTPLEHLVATGDIATGGTVPNSGTIIIR